MNPGELTLMAWLHGYFDMQGIRTCLRTYLLWSPSLATCCPDSLESKLQTPKQDSSRETSCNHEAV